MDELTFRAMGSSCRLVVDGPPGLAERARATVADLEARWSRFLPDSEVTGANRSAGQPTVVSLPTYRLAEHALEAQRLTDGIFDPLLLDPLEALGYDRDHRRLADPGPIDGPPSPTERSSGDGSTDDPACPRRLALDPALSAITVPAGARFDPGGIGKGLAADIVAQDLVDQGAWWVSVELGGDLRFAGASIVAHGWTVVVEDPRDPTAELGRLAVAGGAVATSSRLRRRWNHGGRTHHHLLDPLTRAPATSAVAAATVQSSHAWIADVLAKCLVIGGPEQAESLLRRTGAGAVLSLEDGSIRCVGPVDLLEDARAQ